jgi:hypothetical protein
MKSDTTLSRRHLLAGIPAVAAVGCGRRGQGLSADDRRHAAQVSARLNLYDQPHRSASIQGQRRDRSAAQLAERPIMALVDRLPAG